jgi:hypothetical protein
MMDHPVIRSIQVPVWRFLTLSSCPPEWNAFDLYMIRDAEVVFYAGQSECAYHRVWEHIKGGVHGHSIPGRFIMVNWPKSGSFIIELIQSTSDRFAALNLPDEVTECRNIAEQFLIEEYCPCFNVTLNSQPHPIPTQYSAPNANIKWIRSFKRMMREASYAARNDAKSIKWE